MHFKAQQSEEAKSNEYLSVQAVVCRSIFGVFVLAINLHGNARKCLYGDITKKSQSRETLQPVASKNNFLKMYKCLNAKKPDFITIEFYWNPIL